jgi:hypothetical protein
LVVVSQKKSNSYPKKTTPPPPPPPAVQYLSIYSSTTEVAYKQSRTFRVASKKNISLF